MDVVCHILLLSDPEPDGRAVSRWRAVCYALRDWIDRRPEWQEARWRALHHVVWLPSSELPPLKRALGWKGWPLHWLAYRPEKHSSAYLRKFSSWYTMDYASENMARRAFLGLFTTNTAFYTQRYIYLFHFRSSSLQFALLRQYAERMGKCVEFYVLSLESFTSYVIPCKNNPTMHHSLTSITFVVRLQQLEVNVGTHPRSRLDLADLMPLFGDRGNDPQDHGPLDRWRVRRQEIDTRLPWWDPRPKYDPATGRWVDEADGDRVMVVVDWYPIRSHPLGWGYMRVLPAGYVEFDIQGVKPFREQWSKTPLCPHHGLAVADDEGETQGFEFLYQIRCPRCEWTSEGRTELTRELPREEDDEL